LKRSIGDLYPELFMTPLTPKTKEICEMKSWDPQRYNYKDKKFFESMLKKAFKEIARVLKPNGIAKGARIVAVGGKLTFPWIRGVILVLNVEGPSFFCVNCGSRHIYGLDVIIATDPEMRGLSGNRIIMYGICEECLAKHNVEYFEDKIIKLLKRNDVRGVRVG